MHHQKSWFDPDRKRLTGLYYWPSQRMFFHWNGTSFSAALPFAVCAIHKVFHSPQSLIFEKIPRRPFENPFFELTLKTRHNKSKRRCALWRSCSRLSASPSLKLAWTLLMLTVGYNPIPISAHRPGWGRNEWKETMTMKKFTNYIYEALVIYGKNLELISR